LLILFIILIYFAQQTSKKTRRGSKNKDEVDCYQYLKNSLIALFEVPDSLPLVKNRILQISNFWHVKGKVKSHNPICLFLAVYLIFSFRLFYLVNPNRAIQFSLFDDAS
jgi:hypothetical protein